jgi:hypothetical protein
LKIQQMKITIHTRIATFAWLFLALLGFVLQNFLDLGGVGEPAWREQQ